ncbi:NAD(P)-binding protein [Astrocystis sublimbata]|nr:NAD(P)-binding protein [Astrocystis sublimbata]
MRVAVAGYSDLAHYICEEFVRAGHELVVLTRSHKAQLEAPGITQAVTDYTLSSLKGALADCDAVISTISDISPVYTEIHSTLIKACQESPKCKRFIPAEFAANIETYPDEPGFYYAPHEPVRELLRNQKDVEWTLVCIGWLADYFVPTKNRYIKDIDEFHPVNWKAKKIVIPGTGNEPVDFTWARDVVKALASLIAAPPGSWEPYTFMAGDRSCWNDVTNLIKERYLPDAPTEHVSLHAVAEMIRSAKDEDTQMLADYYLLSIGQVMVNPPEKVQAHRAKFFPGVTFRTLKEGLSQFDNNAELVL